MRMPLRALLSRGSAMILAGTIILGPTTVLAGPAQAATAAPAVSAAAVQPFDVGTVCQSALPSQADDTLNLIAQGGPYPFSKDGEVFDNREGVLPSESYGYYHAYTVITPGASTRGARRIVTGDDGSDYYTADHYASFSQIDSSC